MCDDLVARGECVGLGGNDLAGDVDAGDDRVLANHPAFRGDRERVLVVDARILDANGDLTCGEEGLVDGFGAKSMVPSLSRATQALKVVIGRT
ncbi:hypothetical protein GCM10020255_109560 [Rhodococcus baikonurensis]